MDLTLMAGHCSFETDHVRLALAWVQAVFGQLTPDQFISIAKHELANEPHSAEMIASMKDMALQCLDPAA